MAFLLQLREGTVSQSDIEAIAIQESRPFNKKRPVMADFVSYESITDAAVVEVICARQNGIIKLGNKTAAEYHRAVNRKHKEIVRKIEAGVPGFQYL